MISAKTTSCFDVIKVDEILGIFIDFDLATVTDGSSVLFRNIPSSYEITGTLPFIAIDRLTTRDKTHWPRHDLESFFWLIVLFTSRHHEGKVVSNPSQMVSIRCGIACECQVVLLERSCIPVSSYSAFRMSSTCMGTSVGARVLSRGNQSK